jgi:hypothetical protein
MKKKALLVNNHYTLDTLKISVRWLIPVISATQEAEMGRMAVGSWSGQKVNKTPSQ